MYFDPNKSASYAGKIEYTPPMKVIASTVLVTKPVRGTADSVETTEDIKEGTTRYNGMLPRQNILKVNFLPNLSEKAAHPILPLRFPAAIICTYWLAKAAVTKPGRDELKTSPIIGLATDIRPIPPHASEKKTVPKR
mmetsp:Transcript_7568/g.11328  ORF Transcript_7568/g.11328 Transcript_7568/m.11328 type:complete len:137 (-) Transcript_7568:1125-1535(-)